MKGALYVVSTPIGNLDDISKRAIKTLRDVDLIVLEDTRVSKKLFSRYDIQNKMVVYNNFNEKRQCYKIIDMLNSEMDIALISDAGTPCISDPGYLLINQCKKNNISVYTIPGPSAVTAALSISGLSSDSFYFEGFLPKKKGRKTKFEYLKALKCTVIIFESPKRILKTLNDIKKYFSGNHMLSIHREMTKLYEQNYWGTVDDCIDYFDTTSKCKGEFVIIISKIRNE